MSSEPLPPSDKALPPQSGDTVQTPGSPFKHFLIGFLLSGVPIFVYGSLSIEMTQVTNLKLAIALGLPLLCGMLAAIFKQRFTDVLTAILESVHLPF